MGRTRDVSKILTSNTSILTLASASTTYATKASTALTLINTTSFSGVASQSINDVFSATYTNYKIVGTINGSTTAGLNFRLRASGTDNTTASSYVTQILQANNTSLSGSRSATTSLEIQSITNTLNNAFEAIMIKPFLAESTSFFSNSISMANGGHIYIFGGSHNQTVSYDGFTLIPSAGTITGTIKIYGLVD